MEEKNENFENQLNTASDEIIDNNKETDHETAHLSGNTSGKDSSDKISIQENNHSIEDEFARIFREEISQENSVPIEEERVETEINNSINVDETLENVLGANDFEIVEKNKDNEEADNVEHRYENVVEEEEIEDYESFNQGVVEKRSNYDGISGCDRFDDSGDEEGSDCYVLKDCESIEYSNNDHENTDTENQYDIHNLVEVKEIENLHRCFMCQYATANKRSLQNHISNFHRSKLHKCKYCEKKFSFKAQVQKHIRKEHSRKLRKCPYCSYQKSCIGQVMQRHISQRHGMREYQAKDLNKSKSLKRITKGLYKCDKCSYSSRNLELMTFHIQMHSLKYVLRCLHCYFMANDVKKYKIHLMNAHKLAKEVFVCKKCFFQSEDWKKHSEHICRPHQSKLSSLCDVRTENTKLNYAHSSDNIKKEKFFGICSRNDMISHEMNDFEGLTDNNIRIKEELDTGELDSMNRKESGEIVNSDNDLPGTGNPIEFEEVECIDINDSCDVNPIPINVSVSKKEPCELEHDFLSLNEMIFNEYETHVTIHLRFPNLNVEGQGGSASANNENSEHLVENNSNFLVCPFCDFRIEGQLNMKNHLKFEHLDIFQGLKDFLDVSEQTIAYVIKEEFEKKYCCKLCSHITVELSSLKSHFKQEHIMKNLKCSRCLLDGFLNLRSFWDHINEHCPHCQLWFKEGLQSHILTHVPQYKNNSTQLFTQIAELCSKRSNKNRIRKLPQCKPINEHSFSIAKESARAKLWKNTFEIDNEYQVEHNLHTGSIKNEVYLGEYPEDDDVDSCEEIRIIIDDENHCTSNLNLSPTKQKVHAEKVRGDGFHKNKLKKLDIIKKKITSEKTNSGYESTDSNNSDCMSEKQFSLKPFGIRSIRNIAEKPVRMIKILENQCFDCLNVYKSRYILVDHRKKFHRLKKPHSCTYCIEIFETYNKLKSHYYCEHKVTYHHKGPIFKCPLCDYSCIFLKQMKNHVLEIHDRNAVGFKKRHGIC